MPELHLQPLIPVAAILAIAGSAFADEVVFTNGDRLAGKVVRLAEGKLVLQTEFLGEVSFAADSVRTFSTEAPIEVHLADGTVLHAPAAAGEPGSIQMREAGAPVPRAVRFAEISAINPPKPGVKWSGSVSAGVTVTRGNSDTESATVGAEVVRRAEKDRCTAKGDYLATRQDEKDDNDPTTEEGRETTQRVLRGSLQYDYFISKHLYGYAAVEGGEDRLADLRLRVIGTTGAGVQWIETDDLKLSTEGGFGWLSEYYEDGSEQGSLSARAAYEAEKSFNELVRAFHTFEGYHGFDDPHDFLVHAEGGLRSSLTKSMFGEFKVVFDWDSTPAPDAERTDVRYIFALGWKF
jgi:putative salt-induced outer membrane protein YdiY